MRVYLPATVPLLAGLRATGRLGGPESVRAGHAVTPAVREWYTEGDLEELEYSALTDAAEASLDLLAADPDAPRLRAVVAADLPDDEVTPVGPARSSVRVGGPVTLAAAVSIHLDGARAQPAVVAAIAALQAARDGDDDARFVLDEAAAHDLLWYDVTELDDLVIAPPAPPAGPS